MRKFLIAALSAAVLAGNSAAVETVTIVDQSADNFEAKREIVEIVTRYYGSNAVVFNGERLPAEMNNALTEGQAMPETVPTAPVEPKLAAALEDVVPGMRWLKAGEHLLAVNDRGVIEMGVYDVLP
ncbi:MAG: hypothetical protein AAFV49_21435 [Pseudomonadota bacterium]